MNDSITEQFLIALRQHPRVYMVGIAGIPGSGKTTFCQAIAEKSPGAAVISMDGYHLPRSHLNAEGLRRRGALHTFDGDAFHHDMVSLRRNHSGTFPGFDHAEKDPRPNAVEITPEVPLVIVEGIYVLMATWRSESLFDLRVFLDCSLDVAVDRLTVRHLKTGLASTLEEGRHRALSNDCKNAQLILNDGCRERADLILQSG